MSSPPATPPAAPPAKASPLYKVGLILVAIAIVYAIIIAALHYGTTGNMFAGHSLTRYSSDNPLPLLVGVGVVIFLAGLVLAFMGYPKQQSAKGDKTSQPQAGAKTS